MRKQAIVALSLHKTCQEAQHEAAAQKVQSNERVPNGDSGTAGMKTQKDTAKPALAVLNDETDSSAFLDMLQVDLRVAAQIVHHSLVFAQYNVVGGYACAGAVKREFAGPFGQAYPSRYELHRISLVSAAHKLHLRFDVAVHEPVEVDMRVEYFHLTVACDEALHLTDQQAGRSWSSLKYYLWLRDKSLREAFGIAIHLPLLQSRSGPDPIVFGIDVQSQGFHQWCRPE